MSLEAFLAGSRVTRWPRPARSGRVQSSVDASRAQAKQASRCPFESGPEAPRCPRGHGHFPRCAFGGCGLRQVKRHRQQQCRSIRSLSAVWQPDHERGAPRPGHRDKAVEKRLAITSGQRLPSAFTAARQPVERTARPLPGAIKNVISHRNEEYSHAVSKPYAFKGDFARTVISRAVPGGRVAEYRARTMSRRLYESDSNHI